MCRHVKFELVEFAERLVTDIAGKRPDVAVCDLVRSQCTQPCVRLAAMLTLEWSLTCTWRDAFIRAGKD